VSAHAPTKRSQKVLYAGLFIVLGVVSICLVITQSAETAAAAARLSGALDNLNKSTANISIEQSLNIKLQEQLIAQGKTIADLSRAGIGSVTGGDSYAYLKFTALTNDGGVPVVFHRGKYPIYDMNMRLFDLRKMGTIIHQPIADWIAATGGIIAIGNLMPSGSWTTWKAVSLGSIEDRNYNVFFDARNGFWHETINMRSVNGEWTEAIEVWRQSGKKDILILEDIDRGFPRRSDGQVDWKN